MTREKAIKMLKSKMDGNTDTSYEWAETVRMAIKALEQEDCISRQTVLMGINRVGGKGFKTYNDYSQLYDFVDTLPPVTLKPKPDVLDKMRTEIEKLPNSNPSYWHSGDMVDRDDVLEIIDEYIESEDK